MKKKYIHFSLIACALCVGFLSTAIAAPSVKRFGGKNTYAGTTSAVSAKIGRVGTNVKANSGSRLSSVWPDHSTNTNKTSVVKTTKTGTNTVDAARLSVGQYLHNAGVVSGKIKPISSSSGSSITPSEVSDLTLRIENLENNKADKDDYYTKDEIDNKNYLTQADAETNYATKTETNNISNTVSNIDNRLTAIEQTGGSGVSTVNNWAADKPNWAN